MNHSETINKDEIDDHYTPGSATEMLSQSVQKLNIDNGREDFRAKASKILNTMLENRLNQRTAMNGNGKPSTNGTQINGNGRFIDTNGNGKLPIMEKTVPMPLPKPVAKLSPIVMSNAFNASAFVATAAVTTDDTTNDDDECIATKSLSSSSSMSDLPLPPPPPPCELINTSSCDFNEKHNAADINDNEIISKQFNDDDFIKHSVDGISAAHLSQQQNGFNNGVVYRNKNSRPELVSTHARDRRSYIGQDNSNKFNNNNHLIKSHTTEIVNDFAHGKHPICSVCHVKITR